MLKGNHAVGTRLLLVLTAILPGCIGYEYFQARLPNGDRVPSPCGGIWHPVGHRHERKPAQEVRMNLKFGKDFKENGYKWDACLCNKDSDNDGKTNGEELGDPDCVWIPGDVPAITDPSLLSHPGICEPITTPRCEVENSKQNNAGSPVCPEEPAGLPRCLRKKGTKKFKLQYEEIEIPENTEETLCKVFELPTKPSRYHFVGSMGEISNRDAIQSVTVTGCVGEDLDAALLEFASEPRRCPTLPATCTVPIATWTPSSQHYCLAQNTGIELGKNVKIRYAVMQISVKNANPTKSVFDSSGINLYWRNWRRSVKSVKTGLITPVHFEIPKSYYEYNVNTVCHSECMRNKLTGSIHITTVTPFMRKLGRKFKLEHWRDGEKLADLVDQWYRFRMDRDFEVSFGRAVEVRPGDELRTACTFSSLYEPATTYMGSHALNDEVCLAMFTYYTGKDNTNDTLDCRGYKDYKMCSSEFGAMVRECDVGAYFRETYRKHVTFLKSRCDATGKVCKAGCRNRVQNIYKHPCYNEKIRFMIKYMIGLDKEYGHMFRVMLDTCTNFPADVGPASGDSVLGPVASQQCAAGEGAAGAEGRTSGATACTVGAPLLGLVIVLVLAIFK